MSDIATEIRKHRERCGMSLTDLSEASGVSRGYLHQIEKGASSPTLDKLTLLAGAMGVPVSTLLGEMSMATLSLNERRVIEAYRAGDAGEYMRLFVKAART